MNETLAKYLDALEKSNGELGFTEEEREEFDSFFEEHPELADLREELLNEEVPSNRQDIVERYINSLENDKDLNEQLEDIGFNLDGVKDTTLSNGKRVLIFYSQKSDEPIVIEYDPNKNLLEELRNKQLDYKQYQGLDEKNNAEEMLKAIAKEEKLYIDIYEINKYDPKESKYYTDLEKMKIIGSLIKQAKEKNVVLTGDDQFLYLDEENNYIMTKNGKIIEAKMDDLTKEVVVDSPEEEKQFNDETINEENAAPTEDVLTGIQEEIKDEDHSFVRTGKDVDEDEKYKKAAKKVLEENGFDISEENIKKFSDNLKQINSNSDFYNTIPSGEKKYYDDATSYIKEIDNQELTNPYNVGNEQVLYNENAPKPEEELDKSLEETYVKRLIYKPGQKANTNSEGISNYLYIAIVVLLIAFAVLMYIVFRR